MRGPVDGIRIVITVLSQDVNGTQEVIMGKEDAKDILNTMIINCIIYKLMTFSNMQMNALTT